MNEFKKITIKSIYDLLNSSFPIANKEREAKKSTKSK